MIVGRSTIDKVVKDLLEASELSLDTETTGLYPYKGDRLFSIIIADKNDGYYFNFQAYSSLDREFVLTPGDMQKLRPLFECTSKLWFMHNAKFDLAHLDREDLEIRGQIHCTKAIGRVEYNEHLKYDLASSLKRIGLEKDEAVEAYVEEYKLYDIKEIPGKKTKEKLKHYDRVPFDIITRYGIKDATGTYALGVYQNNSIEIQSDQCPADVPHVSGVLSNERRLTRTVFNMEKIGVRIDKRYCMQASQSELARAEKASQNYFKDTGKNFKASNKDFQNVFESEKANWQYTEKGNPSFESEVLATFSHPAAKHILEVRDAKSKSDFYNGFLYHVDLSGRVHPNFNPDGAGHGRFSSSNPNFQNLTAENVAVCRVCRKGSEECISQCRACGSSDLYLPEFVTRRAIIPSPGQTLVMIDYDQMEYRLMLELACRLLGYETSLVRLVNSGIDVHTATAQVASAQGVQITREQAKTSNFLTIYGGGDQKLADGLKCTLLQAKAIRRAIFDGAPEMRLLINTAQGVATRRGFIFNWLGRKCHFPDSRFAYRAPNYLVAGGCADVVKVAMNTIDDYLQDKKSKMIMTVHDEIVLDVHDDELEQVPSQCKQIMETSFKSKFLPLTCGVEYSRKSLADKVKGLPR